MQVLRICIIERLMSFCSRCFSERLLLTFAREQLPGYVKNVSSVIRQVANRRCAHPSPISQLPTEFRRLFSFSRRRFVAISHLGDGRVCVSPRGLRLELYIRALVVVGAGLLEIPKRQRVGLRSVRRCFTDLLIPLSFAPLPRLFLRSDLLSSASN